MQNLKYKTDLRERCYKFSIQVIKLVDTLPQKRSAWVIQDQLIRSATSIGANLVEAKGSGTRLEFKRFFQIALKSANETRYWLNLLKDLGLADLNKIETIITELNEIAKMITTAIMNLKLKPENF